MNFLFKYAFAIYKPLYFSYKRLDEKEKLKIILSRMQPNTLILDIGANVGFFTLWFNDNNGSSGEVWAFEPDTENLKHLNNLCSKKERIKVFPLALGSENRKIKMYYSSELNVDHQTYDNGAGRKVYEVDCKTLDSIFENSERTPSMIKMDVQGFETFVLKGGMGLISKAENLTLITELWPYGLKKSGSSLSEYLSLLKDLNFDLSTYTESDFNAWQAEESNADFYTDLILTKRTHAD